MFDQLILLARGKMVYSSELTKYHEYSQLWGILARPASISDPMAGVAGRTIEAMSEQRPLL